MTTIGIAGTAKNTGKTTALVAILEQAARRGLPLGLTGIGYDGEERDTVTLLPKPRIRVPAGALVTTSETCLRHAGAQWTDLRRTGFRTALGEVVVVRVARPGLLVVAGPNKTHELDRVIRALDGEGLDLLMVDGSLNRIAPMAAVDRLVFSTGAARWTDPAAVAEEMHAIESILSIPPADRGARSDSESWPTITAGMPVAEAAAIAAGGSGELRWKGLVVLDALTAVVSAAGGDHPAIVFDDPLKLLLAGEIHRVARVIADARASGMRLACAHTPQLAAVTSNPHYPAFDGSVYSGRTLDAERLQRALQAAVGVPVIDVVRDGGNRLFTAAWGLEA